MNIDSCIANKFVEPIRRRRAKIRPINKRSCHLNLVYTALHQRTFESLVLANKRLLHSFVRQHQFDVWQRKSPPELLALFSFWAAQFRACASLISSAVILPCRGNRVNNAQTILRCSAINARVIYGCGCCGYCCANTVGS